MANFEQSELSLQFSGLSDKVAEHALSASLADRF